MSVGDGLTLRSAQGLDLNGVQCLWVDKGLIGSTTRGSRQGGIRLDRLTRNRGTVFIDRRRGGAQ